MQLVPLGSARRRPPRRRYGAHPRTDFDTLSDAVERGLSVVEHAMHRLADDFDAFLALF